MSNSCELCRLETITRLYYEDDWVIIIDCASCQVPMVVLKEHKQVPSPDEDLYMVKKLQEVMKKEYDKKPYTITKTPRSIKEHVHYHARTT